MSLERFYKAQEKEYETALAEIKSGRKKSHWMWYIFPQVKGLGSSSNAQKYALQSAEEAREYIEDPVLGNRLREISEELLNLPGDDPEEIFGYTDAMKLKSCMTLFSAVSDEPGVFLQVLRKYFKGRKCLYTAEFLSRVPENEEN